MYIVPHLAAFFEMWYSCIRLFGQGVAMLAMIAWGILIVIALLVLAQASNIILASLWIIGTISLIAEQGVEAAYVIGCFIFLVLLIAEVVHVCSIEKVLEYRYPRIIGVVTKLAWIGFGALIAYGIFSEEIVGESAYSFAVLSAWLIVSNIPLLALNIALCVPRFRNDLIAFRQGLEVSK